jgi:hypothetical protein
MDLIGTITGIGDGYDDPGAVHISVTDTWEIELVVEDQNGGPTATVILAFDPGFNSAVALALLMLQAERRIGELVAAAMARKLRVTLEEHRAN